MTEKPGRGYDMIVEGDEATVVTEYTPTPRTDNTYFPHELIVEGVAGVCEFLK